MQRGRRLAERPADARCDGRGRPGGGRTWTRYRAAGAAACWAKASGAGTRTARTGLHLVAAAVGGGGPELDAERVHGKDWTYSADDLARFGRGLRTLSWDDREVRVSVPRTATPERRIGLRFLYTNNTHRDRRPCRVDGRELDRFVLEDVERDRTLARRAARAAGGRRLGDRDPHDRSRTT